IHPMDLEPYFSELYISEYPYEHLKYAYSIVLTYSVIEELGIEIRASKEKPSVIDGEWNPEVLSDLKERLNEKNIDPDKTLVWSVRGKLIGLPSVKRTPD